MVLISLTFWIRFNPENNSRRQADKVLFPFFMHACMLSHFSRVQLCATPWTVAPQAPLSMEFSRQEYWVAVPVSRGSSWPGSSYIAGRFFTVWSTREDGAHRYSLFSCCVNRLQFIYCNVCCIVDEWFPFWVMRKILLWTYLFMLRGALVQLFE